MTTIPLSHLLLSDCIELPLTNIYASPDHLELQMLFPGAEADDLLVHCQGTQLTVSYSAGARARPPRFIAGPDTDVLVQGWHMPELRLWAVLATPMRVQTQVLERGILTLVLVRQEPTAGALCLQPATGPQPALTQARALAA